MLAKEFFAACVSGDLVKVREGLCAGLDPNAKYRGQTPLMYACENGHPLVAKLLVQNGAKVNVLDTYGNTALHFACKNGHVSCAAVLMGSGAKTDVESSLGGETPADIARSRGSIEMVRTVLYFDTLMKEENNTGGSKTGSKENSPLRIRGNGEGETSLLVTGGGLDDGSGRAEAANPKEPVRRFDSPPRRAVSQASKDRTGSKGTTHNEAASSPAAGRENSSQTGEHEDSTVVVPAVSIGRRPPPPEADPEENRKSPPRKAANGGF